VTQYRWRLPLEAVDTYSGGGRLEQDGKRLQLDAIKVDHCVSLFHSRPQFSRARARKGCVVTWQRCEVHPYRSNIITITTTTTTTTTTIIIVIIFFFFFFFFLALFF
jgi:hypothetical protein